MEINNTRLDKLENDIASLKELILESRKNDAIKDKKIKKIMIKNKITTKQK